MKTGLLERLAAGLIQASASIDDEPADDSDAPRGLRPKYQLRFPGSPRKRRLPSELHRPRIEGWLVAEAFARLALTLFGVSLCAHRSELAPGELKALIFGRRRDLGPRINNVIDTAVAAP
jgi:hypothetical protein